MLGVALVAAPMLSPLAQPASAAGPYVDQAFETVWSRTDRPVEERQAARSWTWGPQTFYAGYEKYMEGPGSQRLVSYFDKSRMEINNPNGNRNSEWFVTNGLLVVEMMTGRLQVGNNSFQQVTPANIPVAGDVGSSINTPTYATLAALASLNGDHRAPDRTGQQIREGITRNSGVGSVDNLAGFAKYSVYEPTTGHNIPDVFWKFMNQRGVVYKQGRYAEDILVDWLFAMGYPVTEPYWMPIQVGSEQRWVLMQAFQRRILTYSPYNPDGWKVEMGNVGRAYYDWRYAQTQPGPQPTPRPNANISIDPSGGNANVDITVRGTGFPAFVAVQLGAEKPSSNYFRGLGSAATDAAGNFSARVRIPADASGLGQIEITAAANGGAVRASQTYRLQYAPSIAVNPNYMVVNNGTVTVRGDGFPAGINVRLGMLFDNARDIEFRSNVRTDGKGSFEGSFSVGNKPIGAQFYVYAIADSGEKARYDTKMRVIGQPGLAVEPNSGPVGTYVILRGFGWPAGEQVTVGVRGTANRTEAFHPSLVGIDGAGNFAVQVFLNSGYATERELRLIAVEAKSGIRLEAPYLVAQQVPPTPTPVPGNAVIAVNPNTLVAGQAATVTGNRWPVGANVTLTLNAAGVQEIVGSAGVDRDGNFATSFVVGPRWANAGQVTLSATVPNGPAATAILQIGASSGRIVESGMPMGVTSYIGPDASYVKVYGQGWRQGKTVDVAVVAANGSINTKVATALVKADGTWQAAFAYSAQWSGRTDIGITAGTIDDTQSSTRYLPVTNLSKVTGGTYNVQGGNWPANTHVVAVLMAPGIEEQMVGAGNTDGNGALNFNIDVPRVDGREYQIEMRSTTPNALPYKATFGFTR
jgi:hypothetical protein